MNAAEYRAGETVDVTIRCAQVAFEPVGGRLTLIVGKNEAGHDRYVDLPLDALDARRVTPADGVPQPGDLWVDAVGSLYFATGRRLAGFDRVQLCAEDGGSQAYVDWGSIHAGPTGPISLHYRRDPAPEPTDEPAADDPVPADVQGQSIGGRP